MSTQPMTFTISREDLLRSKVVEPGWYHVKITKIVQEPASTDGSTNTVVDMIVVEGNFKDVPLRRYFNEKAAGFAVNFFKALGAQIGEQGQTLKLEGAIGKELKCYVKNEMYGTNMQNRVEDFQPLK